MAVSIIRWRESEHRAELLYLFVRVQLASRQRSPILLL